MNIGIVTTWFERGAAYVSRAYMETLSTKHRVFIFARAGEKTGRGSPDWDRDYVTWSESVPGKMLTHINEVEFKTWVEQRQLDMVIFNEQISWDIILKARALPIRIGAYVDYYQAETVPFFWLYDFLLCNTKRHYSVFKVHPQAIYIPWGTDIKTYSPREKPYPTNNLVFFHSCGLSPYRKGTDILIKAFTHVKGQARLVIHIQSFRQQWPPHPSVTEMVEKARDRRIEVIEAEVGAPGLYHLGDIYPYPTRLEGIGLTIAEALACGLPVITTDNPPMNEFVQQGLSGRLVKIRKQQMRPDHYYWPETICDEDDLALALQFYVDHQERLDEYRHNARQYAEQHLDWSINSKSLPDSLENVPRLRDEQSRQLELSAAQYEQDWYKRKYPDAFYPLVVFLNKIGASRVTHLGKRILNQYRSKAYKN